ncbi:hypothetical protein [Verrucomicrobium sp. GAS474]|uniref:hypothetical protein n=1 Tax=Verrucomicrobium sp. GAS474 TaxID=1882831 RepID=UPI000B80FB4B|nr:hypothetical protein [Verrucomicrobium sp. GAS474]
MSHLTEGTKEKEIRAGIDFMGGKLSAVQPLQSFRALDAEGAFSRHSGLFRVGADYAAFRLAEDLWPKVRNAPANDSNRNDIEAFYVEAQDRLKQDLLSSQYTAADLGSLVGESNLWDKLNRDPH